MLLLMSQAEKGAWISQINTASHATAELLAAAVRAHTMPATVEGEQAARQDEPKKRGKLPFGRKK